MIGSRTVLYFIVSGCGPVISRQRGESDPGGAVDEPKSCPYYPAPIVVIDASDDPDTVFREIQREVLCVLANRTRP